MPIDTSRYGRGLLDWFNNDEPVVDRATLLPIGQYDDGSLTFAWPGMIKDAYEGALRSYLDAGNVPVPDAAPVTKWSSNLDALNAASIAPMAGVAGRVTGAIPRGSLGSGGGDITRRAAIGSAREAGLPSGFPEPIGTPSGRSGEGPLVHSQREFQGPQAPGTHTTTQSDLLRDAYDKRAPLPEGWFVHGRYGQDHLRSDVPIQATRDYDVMEQYGKWGLNGEHGGSGWAIKPKPDANVLDFTDINTRDARHVGALALRDYRDGLFPDAPYERLSPRELSERFRGHFAPDDLVGSAAAFDDTSLLNWLVDTVKPRPQFVLTPDGAVALDRDAIDAVRLFANDSRAAAPAIAASAVEKPKGITAYHGSPHDFDKFDFSKVGTGQGDASHGLGGYFTSNENVARGYKEFSEGAARTYDGGRFNPDLPAHLAAYRLSTLGADRAAAIAELSFEAKRYAGSPRGDRARDAVQHIQNGTEAKRSGAMYEVNIKATPEQFNDWTPGSGAEDAITRLKAQGYVGNKVPDPSNDAFTYVMFPGNEHLVEILRKYANPETASLPYLMSPESEPGGLLGPDPQPELPPLFANLQQFGPQQIPRDMKSLTAPWNARRPDWDLYWENMREPQPAPFEFQPPQQRRRFVPVGLLSRD